MKKAAAAVVTVLALLVGAGVAGVVAATLTATAATSCGPGGEAEQVSGIDLDAEQLASARTIVQATASRAAMTRQAATIAVATAMQESSLRNITHGDRDSVGLFQQRPSQGWGTVAQILDPIYATTKFLNGLAALPGWESMPLTVAAQRVQRSGYPDAYAKFEQMATDLAGRFWPAGAPAGGSPTPGEGPSLPPTPDAPTVPAAGWVPPCTGGDGLDDTGGAGGVPAGYVPPTNAQQAAVVAFALDQVGEPYVWGGTGPDGWDCSGLMLKAWASVGVAVPRVTFDQVKSGAPVAGIAAAQPGDLIFIAGSDGTPDAPGHVGMYIGLIEGKPYLVDAPQSGVPVGVKPVSRWDNLIVAIRRPAGGAA